MILLPWFSGHPRDIFGPYYTLHILPKRKPWTVGPECDKVFAEITCLQGESQSNLWMISHNLSYERLKVVPTNVGIQKVNAYMLKQLNLYEFIHIYKDGLNQ